MKQKLATLGDIAYLLNPVVSLSWMFQLARVHGRLRYLLRRETRAAIHGNIAAVCAEQKNGANIDRLTRQFFEYQQLRSLLVYLAPRLSLPEMSRLFPVEGLERLDWAVAQGKGVIVLGSHLNSVCMFSAVALLRRRGYRIGVALPTPEPHYSPSLLRRLLAPGSTEHHFTEHIGGFYAQFNVRPIIRRLQDKEAVAMAGDGWHSAAFAPVEFLGRTLPFTTGAMSIARLTGSMVVPLFVVGPPPDGLRVVLEEPFTVEKGRHPESEVQAKVSAWAKRLEHHLLENISCWHHWVIPNTLESMAAWPQRSLRERYEL